jgi:membrane-associated HD superfamily phosphohydrolase
MSEARWNTLQQESVRVLEQVMRTAVRTENLELLPTDVAARVSLTLNEQDADLVSGVVLAFVIPNSQYSQELTTAAQAAAREAVEPVVRSYQQGETIVAGGEIITEADMEALQSFGLVEVDRPVETF